MIYFLALSGPFLNRHGKKYFKNKKALMNFLMPIYTTSQRETASQYGYVEANCDLIACIRIVRINEELLPGYKRYFPEIHMTRNKIKKPKGNDNDQIFNH